MQKCEMKNIIASRIISMSEIYCENDNMLLQYKWSGGLVTLGGIWQISSAEIKQHLGEAESRRADKPALCGDVKPNINYNEKPEM